MYLGEVLYSPSLLSSRTSFLIATKGWIVFPFRARKFGPGCKDRVVPYGRPQGQVHLPVVQLALRKHVVVVRLRSPPRAVENLVQHPDSTEPVGSCFQVIERPFLLRFFVIWKARPSTSVATYEIPKPTRPHIRTTGRLRGHVCGGLKRTMNTRRKRPTHLCRFLVLGVV